MFSKFAPGYITRSTAIILAGGAAAFGLTEILFGGEVFYEKAMMPFIQRSTDGERAHRLAIKAASWGLMPRFGPNHWQYPELKCQLFGHSVSNPIGIAAGFDKDGEILLPLARSGFGMVEIGSVTPLPQPGNDQPRVFRLLQDKALINRYGFNSAGVGAVQQKVVAARAAWPKGEGRPLLGVNLGKNKFSEDARMDYEMGVTYFGPYVDYLVVNVSSPNTPGLRSMQSKKELEKLMEMVAKAVSLLDTPEKPAVLIKLAPDLVEEEMKDIAQVVMDKRFNIQGLIISNTTVSRPTSLQSDDKDEFGGLSGRPLKEMSTECVRQMYRLTKGTVPIIGVGGIECGQDAYEKIRAGASAVQLYTALVYQGFPVIGKVKRELAECLRRDGFASVAECVGCDHRLPAEQSK